MPAAKVLAPSAVGGGSSKSTTSREQFDGQLDQDARAVTAVGLGARGAAVFEMLQGDQPVDDDGVRPAALDIGDHGDATGVRLVVRVVKPLGLGECRIQHRGGTSAVRGNHVRDCTGPNCRVYQRSAELPVEKRRDQREPGQITHHRPGDGGDGDDDDRRASGHQRSSAAPAHQKPCQPAAAGRRGGRRCRRRRRRSRRAERRGSSAGRRSPGSTRPVSALKGAGGEDEIRADADRRVRRRPGRPPPRRPCRARRTAVPGWGSC